jgi:hypothetical protein
VRLCLIIECHDAVADSERPRTTRRVEIAVAAVIVGNAVGRRGRGKPGTLAVWKETVAVKRASNFARVLAIAAAKGLVAPTQHGQGISASIVWPVSSCSTMW